MKRMYFLHCSYDISRPTAFCFEAIQVNILVPRVFSLLLFCEGASPLSTLLHTAVVMSDTDVAGLDFYSTLYHTPYVSKASH
jgi:hypothetical protein